MSGTPIVDTIETTMISLIEGMDVSHGWNFDWGDVNDEDIVGLKFPVAIIDPTDSLADKETCVDTLAGLSSLDYSNEILFTILVVGEMPEFSSNPNFECRSLLRKALDDLKMLFGINLNLLATCDNIMYVGSQIEVGNRNDMQRPAKLRSIWKVVYSQDRRTPTMIAGG
jgi:hypothetical protein